MSQLPEILHRVNIEIMDDVKKELRLQGHYLTGELENSFVEKLVQEKGGVTLTAVAADYLQTLEQFTPPGQIRIDNAEFDKLKKWVLLRGLASFDHEATSVAAAIVSHWRKEGRPTENSKQFSKTGKRIEAITDAMTKNASTHDSLIGRALTQIFDSELMHIKSGTV